VPSANSLVVDAEEPRAARVSMVGAHSDSCRDEQTERVYTFNFSSVTPK
jgi:hypothetical protein